MAKKTTLYFYPWKKNDKEDHSIYIHESRMTKKDHALVLSLEKE